VITAAEYSISSQLWIQFKGVAVTFVWSGVVAFISYKIVDMIIGLRVPEEEEREGLDVTIARRGRVPDVRVPPGNSGAPRRPFFLPAFCQTTR